MRNARRKFRGRLFIAPVAMAAIGMMLVCFWWYAPDTNEPDLGVSSAQRAQASQGSKDSATKAVGGSPVKGSVHLSAEEIVVRCYQRLRASNDPATNASILRDLRALLQGAEDRAGAVAAIIGFLDSGQDAQTGLGFAVQQGGSLAAAPSLRVALLDFLGELDRAEAARYAEAIFLRSNVPDEWALALRDQGKNMGKSAASSSPSYNAQVSQLLTRQDWLREPTAGFLHAFDAAVYVGQGAGLMNVLEGTERADVQHAARLAIDRLVLESFGEIAQKLAGGGVLAGHPTVRAQMMARANPMDATEMVYVEQYLRNGAVTDAEAMEFFSTFPNANLELTNSLLTKNPFLRMDLMAQMDAAALAVTREWRSSGRVGRSATILDRAIQRFTEYEASYQRGLSENAKTKGGGR